MKPGIEPFPRNNLDLPDSRAGAFRGWAFGVALFALLVSAAILCALLNNSTPQCDQFKATASVAQLRDDLAALTAQRNRDADELIAFKGQADKNRDYVLNELLSLRKEIATSGEAKALDLTSPSYVPLRTAVGQMLVSCEGIQPYLDGYCITFKIGNLTTANVSGGTLHLEFGPALPASLADWGAWERSIQKVDVAFVNDLLGGTWTKVPINIAPLAAKNIAYLQVSLTTDRLSLRSPER